MQTQIFNQSPLVTVFDDFFSETSTQKISTSHVKAFNNRAYCLAKLGRYEEAIVDYTTVIQHEDTNIHALHNRGISYERLARYTDAVADFS